MFNPLAAFEPQFLEGFRKKGVKAFVRQTYNRGRGIGIDSQDAFIMIHFENELAAQQYFDVIKNDPSRFLYKMEEPADIEQVKELLGSAKVYTILKIKDADIKLRKVMDKKIRAFIEYKLRWQPGGGDHVSLVLDVQFGEVYAKLKFRSKEITVKLEEIENANYVL